MNKRALYALKARCAVDELTDCWLYQGHVRPNGYAWVMYEGKTWFGHRLAYTLKFGPIPAGKDCGQTCKGPRHCINPEHHKPGTRTQIMRSVIERGRIAKGVRKGIQYRGERSHFAKLDWAKVRQIRARLAEDESKHTLAAEYVISVDAIYKIARFETWKEGFAA